MTRKTRTAVAVVVLVCAIVGTGIAMRWWRYNRVECSHIHCTNTLRMIVAAKERCVQEHGWTNGTPCDTTVCRTDIEKWIKSSFLPPYTSLKCHRCRRIQCTYRYNPIGVAPSCALGDPSREFVKTGLLTREPNSMHRLSEDEMRREQLASPYSVTPANGAAPGVGEL